MKKIFCYAGSNNPKSITRKICSQLLIELNQLLEKEVQIKIYDGNTARIAPVRNADSFFSQDTLDKTDSMEIIKKDMLDSQIVILGSPVYFHNVSGDIKNFIDRLSYMTHLFPFMEKKAIGVVVVCGSYCGSDEVVKYLLDFEKYLGLGSINVIEYNSSRMPYNELRRNISMVSQKVARTVNSGIIKHSSSQIASYNEYFEYYNSLGIETKETIYWHKKKRLQREK